MMRSTMAWEGARRRGKYSCICRGRNCDPVGSPILPVETAIAVSTGRYRDRSFYQEYAGRKCDRSFYRLKLRSTLSLFKGLNEQLHGR